jgi:hypothetical protein
MVDPLNRRNLLLSAAALGVAGCSTSEVRKNSPFWSTVTNNRPQTADADVRAYAASLAYSSMLFWFDGQSRSLIVLAREDADQRLTWITAEQQAITTFGPFIVKAKGTEVELRDTEFGDGWSQDVRDLVGKTLTRQTLVAHRDREATATLQSRFRDAGLHTVKVLGETRQLRRIDESVIADNRVRILNSYWIDLASGDWQKGRQQVIPMLPPVNTIIMPRPATASTASG